MEYNDTNLLMLDAQGKSLGQIASALHVTRDKVKGRLTRIKKDGGTVFDRSLKPKAAKEVKVKPPKPQRRPPNINTFSARGRRGVQMSKADMQEMLRRAVENTK